MESFPLKEGFQSKCFVHFCFVRVFFFFEKDYHIYDFKTKLNNNAPEPSLGLLSLTK